MKQVPETKIKLTDVKELINKGYNLLGELREEADAPVAKAEFLTEEITTVYGEEAARKFYNPENFKREGSMPKVVLKTLFGEDGVQTIDGKKHHQRKNYFMDLMTPERMEDYRAILDQNLATELDQQHGTFELFDLSKRVLFNSICEWAGINLAQYDPKEIDKLASNQISMISGAITSPTDHLKGVKDRNESEGWAQSLIKEARKNPVPGKENLALYTFAQAEDLEGELLPVEVAAVELLNIIRLL